MTDSFAVDAAPTAHPTGMADTVVEISATTTRVRPSELWHRREVAWIVALRDIRIKYKQSVLGPLWLVLQPLGVLGGLIFVFHGVTKVRTEVPYLLFSLASLSAWTFVQQTVSSGANVFLFNASFIRRVAFPRTALFTANLLSNLLPPAVMFAVAVGATLVERGLPVQVLLLPLVLIWIALLLTGIMMMSASLAVRFRDVMALVPFWLQVGVFLTPVGYPASAAPQTLRTLLSLNPLTGLLEVWRWCFFGTSVSTVPVVSAMVGTALILTLGWVIFVRMEGRFADFI